MNGMSLFDMMGSRRSGGLGQILPPNPNVSQPTTSVSSCPPCKGCHPIFYLGTAIGGALLLGILLKH